MGGKRDWSEVKRILAQAPFPIALALLFGSHARGEALEGSDPDLPVVFPAFRGMPYPERLAPLYRLPLRHVDWVALTPKEWEARRGGSAWWGRPPGKGWSFSRP